MSASLINDQPGLERSVTVIRPSRGWVSVDLRELWQYRELLYFLTWRDVKVRYKQTIIGFAWAILQPVFMMIVFSLFFGILANIPSGNVPYPLFTYAALLPWMLFSNGLNRASLSLVADANLIQKVYFPRMLLPISGILSPLIDFAIAFVVLIGLMFYFGFLPGFNILWVLVFLLLELMLAAGLGLWLAAINVEYRDIAYAIPFLLQLVLFASPVIYSSSFVPPRYQVIYGLLNPMAGIIEGLRWAILGTDPPGVLVFASAGIIIFVLISGVYYFKRREKLFADVV